VTSAVATRVLAPFGRRAAAVVSNEELGAYRLVSVEDRDGPPPLPGQFYMLAADPGWGDGASQRPYLARAFSVCRVREATLAFLVDAIGPGTRRLEALAPGEQLLLVGPLGRGFSAPTELGCAGAILVAGGVGAAPLVIWAEALGDAGASVRSLLGFRSADHARAASLFPGAVGLATDDGSLGHQGLVTDLLPPALERAPDHAVYACGPPAMLEAVRRICAERSASAELALEQAMACGFGACFGCVVRTVHGYRRICVDGPVIAASDLDESWASH
jgi:dihydroorotate dehydrogenase electron transfer subunit